SALATIAVHAVAEGLARGFRCDLVRGVVLPAAVVRLPHGHHRWPGARALRGDGAAAVLHHERRGGGFLGVRRLRFARGPRLARPGMAAREAAAGGAARRLPLLVLPADAGPARRDQPALTALVSLVQRGTGPVPPCDRHPGGREALARGRSGNPAGRF